MLENRPEDALVLLVETVEIDSTASGALGVVPFSDIYTYYIPTYPEIALRVQWQPSSSSDLHWLFISSSSALFAWIVPGFLQK